MFYCYCAIEYLFYILFYVVSIYWNSDNKLYMMLCTFTSLEIFGKIWISTTIVFRQSQTFVLRHYRNENESSFSVLFHILLISIYFIWIINWRMNGKRLPFKKKKRRRSFWIWTCIIFFPIAWSNILLWGSIK